MHIFLDESGNFEDGYFVVGGFVTGDPKRTSKAFRKWQHSKFPKKLRAKTEVKFTDTGLDDKLLIGFVVLFTVIIYWVIRNFMIAYAETL